MIALILVCLFGTAHAEDIRLERGYKKGRPLKIKLTPIGWAEVEIKTARAFRKMEAAAAKSGVSLVIRSGFRSHERQQLLYRAFKEGWGNQAARPGYSNHQAGTAVDLYVDAEMLAWMAIHAKKFGFKQTVRGEPWHWEYKPAPRKKLIARTSSQRRR